MEGGIARQILRGIFGPSSSTDNVLVRFDGTTGKTVQNGQTVEDDSGNLTVAGNITTPDGGTIGQATGPLLTFDDSNNELELTGGTFSISSADASAAVKILDTTNSYYLTLGHDNTVAIIDTSSGTVRLETRINGNIMWAGHDSGGVAFGSTYYATDPGSNNIIMEGNLALSDSFPASMTKGLGIALGTDPTADVADQFSFWGKDIAAGNTGPAFRTEDGTVIQLNQSLLTTDDVQFDTMDLINQTASDDILTVKGAVSQSGALLNLTNSSDTSLFKVWHSGHTETTDGFRTTCAQYGPGFWIHLYGEETPEHTNGVGSYDHTGGSSEKLFTKTSGDDFTQADEDNGNWILLIGANLGAVAEIKEFIDADNVTVDGMGWDGDIASQSFYIYKHPLFVSGDGAKHEFSVKSSGEFEVHSYDFTENTMAHFKNSIASDTSDAIKIDIVGNGYQDLSAVHAEYETGDLQPGDSAKVLHIKTDETSATSADTTTNIRAIDLEKTNVNASIETEGMHIGPGFTEALHIVGTSPIDPAFGYEVSGGGTTETDRVNGAAGDGNAFLEAGNDLQIFDTNNDYILIGSAATFEIIEIILATGSSKNILPEFYYTSDGAGTYTQFFPSDSTDGFKNSGTITFSAPAGWTADNQSMDGSAITNGYYIAIKRTKTGTLTYPVENYFKTYANQVGGMYIRGDGVVKLPYLGEAPSNLENGMMWMESNGLHLYYSGGEEIVTVV